MADELRWDDTEELAVALTEKYPMLNPLEVRLSALRSYVTQLPIFVDDPESGSELQLNAIQNAWNLEWQDRQK